MGSFACGAAGLPAVLEGGAVPLLIKALRSGDGEVVAAGAKALKLVFTADQAAQADLFAGASPQPLPALLASEVAGVAEVAAFLLARCALSPEQKAALAEQGALEGLFRLLRADSPKAQLAALSALATLSRGQRDVGRLLLAEAREALLAATRAGPAPLRLQAAAVSHFPPGVLAPPAVLIRH